MYTLQSHETMPHRRVRPRPCPARRAPGPRSPGATPCVGPGGALPGGPIPEPSILGFLPTAVAPGGSARWRPRLPSGGRGPAVSATATSSAGAGWRPRPASPATRRRVLPGRRGCPGDRAQCDKETAVASSSPAPPDRQLVSTEQVGTAVAAWTWPSSRKERQAPPSDPVLRLGRCGPCGRRATPAPAVSGLPWALCRSTVSGRVSQWADGGRMGGI